jgi:hypothetical protein
MYLVTTFKPAFLNEEKHVNTSSSQSRLNMIIIMVQPLNRILVINLGAGRAVPGFFRPITQIWKDAERSFASDRATAGSLGSILRSWKSGAHVWQLQTANV